MANKLGLLMVRGNRLVLQVLPGQHANHATQDVCTCGATVIFLGNRLQTELYGSLRGSSYLAAQPDLLSDLLLRN